MPERTTKRCFTEAARIAAADARRRKRELRAAGNVDFREVFVVRQPEIHVAFCWEIRWFGGIVVERSADSYPGTRDARCAGEQALSELRNRP